MDGALTRLLAAVAALALCGAAVAAPATGSEAGERLYREGRLPSGEPLRGDRVGAPPLLGHDAACEQCHRRSGLGMVEGRIVFPPLAGRFLFRPGKRISPDRVAHDESTHLPPTPPDRGAYNEATLARAIREGIGPDGKPLDYLMPRFDIDDASMHQLVAYLKRLGGTRVPGVTDSALQFATVITPDADPTARDGMLAVLRNYAVTNNETYYGSRPSQTPDGRTTLLHRQWSLHVWQLEGGPDTWEAQLEQRLRAEPVFAILSGIGGANWEPVHRFCEHKAIPCLLPNIDLPVVNPDDFYPVYFSQGVLLEAQLLAAHRAPSPPSPLPPSAGEGRSGVRIVQIYRGGDIGAAAAARLHAALANGPEIIDRVLQPGDGPRELAQAVSEAKQGETLVLWLRAADLERLPAPPPGLATVYASGVMGGLERAPLAPAWRSLARLTYPYELPQARRLRMGYPLGWFHFRKVAVVDERVQTDTYIACSILSQALTSMLGEFDRDYLVERVEAMLSTRLVDGYYSHLGLAPGQRFASKGGYLVRFSGPTGSDIAADGDWTVP